MKWTLGSLAKTALATKQLRMMMTPRTTSVFKCCKVRPSCQNSTNLFWPSDRWNTCYPCLGSQYQRQQKAQRRKRLYLVGNGPRAAEVQLSAHLPCWDPCCASFLWSILRIDPSYSKLKCRSHSNQLAESNQTYLNLDTCQVAASSRQALDFRIYTA